MGHRNECAKAGVYTRFTLDLPAFVFTMDKCIKLRGESTRGFISHLLL